MYEDLLKDVQEKMKPAIDVAEANKKAVEALFSLQSEYVTDFVDSSVAQMKALSETKDPKEAVDLQLKFFKTLEGKLTSVAEKELAAITAAKEEIAAIIEKSLAEIGEMPYFTDFNKFMTEAVEAATAATAAAVETAVETATAEAPAAEEAPAAPKAPAKRAPAKRKVAPKAAE
ncbi:phasin family protein [Neptuniibacter sp. CAU 1671]|uniref:phasin family protein n=1 Tax=Neptuniibacter sp. CAU 1671 TaxID=3032593 RepID=UPI0023DB9EC4|nr:phasin family protein [Neptuniibacter sp. CAU 1671]MDF2180679.1 phasin family protein [Neptuniibacter sp. CAU 1671]